MFSNRIVIFVLGLLVGYYLLDRVPVVADLLP